MLVLAQSDYFKKFALAICIGREDCAISDCELLLYPNGEMFAQISTDSNIDGQDCIICGSIAPPDAQMLSMLCLVNALKHAGAKSVNLVLPYLAYSRHDKPAKNQSAGTALVGAILRAAGVNKIITLDVHSAHTGKVMNMPVASLSASQLSLPYINELGWNSPTVVAPDAGALERARHLAKELGINDVTGLVKKHVDGIVHVTTHGPKVGEKVILVDDILDTGGTLISACNALKQRGAKEFVVVASHGLFSGDHWPELFELGVTKIFVTDSCPQAAAQKHANIHVLPTALLVAEGINK